MVELRFQDGSTTFRPAFVLERLGKVENLEDRLAGARFGRLRDLQRLVTFQKLRGTLQEVIYSMDAAEIDFYPYQFKPVLKFINSPTERLILADEVGLGKTIESALIWTELRARRQAKRLLVVCPKTLTSKWRDELQQRFLIDARVVDFVGLQEEVQRLRNAGPAHQCVLIASYTSLRPSRAEIRSIYEPPEQQDGQSPKAEFLGDLFHWNMSFYPFDLVIFDEAHYMRNPGTATFALGKCLAASAGGVLCVSATPLSNSNEDLRSLLRLVDEGFFETEAMFEQLLATNRPAVQAANALARNPVDHALLQQAVEGMAGSPFIRDSPLFRQFLELLERLEPTEKALLARCQEIAEKLNLLGGYLNRTRRVHVADQRPIREAMVLPVNYTEEEMRLYGAILHLVRRKCQQDSRPFHVFQVMGMQLRAASCLPAVADEIRDGRFGRVDEFLIEEALGGGTEEEALGEGAEADEVEACSMRDLLEHDFERSDSKYSALHELLTRRVPSEKVLIFAYYRATLAYLQRRLAADGITAALIHGGVDNEDRWRQIERFSDPNGPRVLLSSEVGSEGIDLQFCRVVVNYDLPWNPMRVEQRIGRIDRVGQMAKRLAIVNFKVKGTIEERLYDRLHSKLERFANSLGDLEAVIGREVQTLTVELLRRELTPEQEAEMMDRSESVIERRLLTLQTLEQEGDALVALSDYVQKKIIEDREKGRYVQPEELEDYVADFFEIHVQGCELNHNTPAQGCLRLRLSDTARRRLETFLQNDQSRMARPLRSREFNFTFRREAHQRLTVAERRTVHFTNHLCPLVRWITRVNEERLHTFFNVSAVMVTHPTLPPGDYCYRVERWRMKGLSGRENLAYGVIPLGGGEAMSQDDAERAFRIVQREGRDWDYVDCDLQAVVAAHETLKRVLVTRFSHALDEFRADNDTAHQIRRQRVVSFFDRRIAEDEQRLQTLLQSGRSERVIRMTRGRLRTAEENKSSRLSILDASAELDAEQTPVAAGVFRATRVAP